MFRKNTSHLQPSLFGIASQLPEAKLKKLKNSKEYDFYRLVFCKINEKDARFDVEICKQCPLSRNCPPSGVHRTAKQQSDKRTYYFDRSDYLLGKRNRNIKSLPPERRKLRPNVEATPPNGGFLEWTH